MKGGVWRGTRRSPLEQYHRWHQQSLTDTFASHLSDEVFDAFSFPYIEDIVNLPTLNRYAARWHQQSLTDNFASHFPDEVCNAFSFPDIEDIANLPAFNDSP